MHERVVPEKSESDFVVYDWVPVLAYRRPTPRIRLENVRPTTEKDHFGVRAQEVKLAMKSFRVRDVVLILTRHEGRPRDGDTLVQGSGKTAVLA